MLSGADLRKMQQEQFAHDQRNHYDLHFSDKSIRLSHYGHHYAKYVGRLFRAKLQKVEQKSLEQTIVDTFLIALSAANTLRQRLDCELIPTIPCHELEMSYGALLADLAGAFNDACDKMHHQEEFLANAKSLNLQILGWAMSMAQFRKLDIRAECIARRRELAQLVDYYRR